MSWLLKENLQKKLAAEQGAQVFAPGSRTGFALVYPNTYHVGMSNLGFHIIYQQINSRNDAACERVFLPDKKNLLEHERTNTPLMTLETQRALYEFPLIGFAVTFEMDYFNIIKILSMGKVNPLAEERDEADPIVIIGGPCATFNPEPLADIADVCVIGEGEEVIHELLDVYQQSVTQGLSRQQTLRNMAGVPGLYVPRFYQPVYDAAGLVTQMQCSGGVPSTIQRRWVKNLDAYPAHTVIVTEDTEFKDMYLVEVARGCGRHCRFCMAGYCYRSPRIRSLEQLKKVIANAKGFHKKIGLMGAAISDYPYIDELSAFILENELSMSVASLRADTLTQGLVDALVQSKHRTITLAPEAASEQLRRVINKTITDDHLYQSMNMAVKAGIPNVRLYIMIGLPYEEQEDIEEIITMTKAFKQYMESVGSKGRLTLSINPFIPKPFTPFQWMPMANKEIVEERLKYIKAALKGAKGIEVLIESPKEAYIQGVLARGNRKLGKVLITALENGGAKAFASAMKENGYRETDYLYRERSREEILPWNHLDMGLDSNYLLHELNNAEDKRYTAACTTGCMRCGICKPEQGGNKIE